MKNTNETKLTIEALQKIMNGDLGGAREMMNNKKKIDELVNNMVEKVQKEYDEFKEYMLQRNPEYIFNEAYTISCYTDLLYYFENDGFYNEITKYFEHYTNNAEDIQNLESFSEKNILNALYQGHFNYENLYFTSWEDIDILVEYIIFNKLF